MSVVRSRGTKRCHSHWGRGFGPALPAAGKRASPREKSGIVIRGHDCPTFAEPESTSRNKTICVSGMIGAPEGCQRSSRTIRARLRSNPTTKNSPRPFIPTGRPCLGQLDPVAPLFLPTGTQKVYFCVDIGTISKLNIKSGRGVLGHSDATYFAVPPDTRGD